MSKNIKNTKDTKDIKHIKDTKHTKDAKQNLETLKLGPRLHTIASYVPQGASLGDIGTDHAYLPVYLMQKGIITKAIGVDIHQGPYTAACQTVSEYGLKDKIEVRLGDGLAPLAPGEVDTLTIAGMGGTTILEILNSNTSVMQEVSALILQPQGGESRVRRELLVQGWKLWDECLVCEEGRVYTIICLSKTKGCSLKDLETQIAGLGWAELADCRPPDSNLEEKTRLENLLSKVIWQLGPLILLKKDQHLVGILQETLANLHKVIKEMSKTERETVRKQANEKRQEIKILEGIRTWLSQ
ncbi:MAG: tRNA (adenine(22)-N(1))-methyltransferase [Desulfitobacteriia bacterium]